MIAHATLLLLQLALGATTDVPAIDAPGASERIESIAMDVSGPGGTLVTRAIALDGGRSSFAFGGKSCRDHKVEAIVLEQLFEAMRTRQGVRVTGKAPGSGGAAVQCLAAITFYAPDA